MTFRVDSHGGVREAAAAAVVTDRTRTDGDPSVPASARSAPASAPPSDPSAASDASAYGRIASVLVVLTDPLAVMGFARALVRETQVSAQEDNISTQNDRAAAEAQTRMEALKQAIQSAQDAKGWGIFAQIVTRVAAAIVAAVGFVAGAFSGGAGAVLAVGLLVVAFGQDLQAMMKEGGVDSDITNAIGLGATAIGTVCTLGVGIAGAAGLVAQVATTTLTTVSSLAEAGADIVAGTGQAISSGYTWDAAQRRIDGEQATLEVNDALDSIDESVADVRSFMQSYARVVQRLTRAAEARDEAMHAAAGTRA